ncbi:MAG: efflux RND transporter periplasmic adaptor subunit [Bacteroidetes bacterium]|nr:efflux RND transporter periplasmic adaptor subunit [Bacteroidota bacterium]
MMAVLAFSGCGSDTAEKAAGGSNILLTVEAEIATKSRSENLIRSTGTTLSHDEVNIQSEVNGRIVKIHFTEGSMVNKGQLLVKLDDEELQALLKKSILEKKLAEEREQRHKRLLEIEAISQEEYDATKNAYEVFAAHISMLKAQIQKTEIRAPFSGTIGLRNVSEGAIIAPGAFIASLQNFSPIKLDFSVPEKYARQINPETEIFFTIEGSTETFTAKVFAIEPRIDPVSRTLKIRALSSNKEGKILPGAFANVSVQLGKASMVIRIPSQAIIPDISGAKVFTLKDGKATLTEVTTGIRTDARVHINSGLQEGDTVITSGILQIKSGMPVNVNILVSEKVENPRETEASSVTIEMPEQ